MSSRYFKFSPVRWCNCASVTQVRVLSRHSVTRCTNPSLVLSCAKRQYQFQHLQVVCSFVNGVECDLRHGNVGLPAVLLPAAHSNFYPLYAYKLPPEFCSQFPAPLKSQQSAGARRPLKLGSKVVLPARPLTSPPGRVNAPPIPMCVQIISSSVRCQYHTRSLTCRSPDEVAGD